jgi:riboflavin kinase/FMN adenylyltransferase
MTASTVIWSHDMPGLGASTIAIGVFDGVHIGHQALLRETVADAADHRVQSVAVTFDRDPDQIVSPQTAAPQLLSLADKLECISETGIDVILVVPFTTELAEMAPEVFVDTVLLGSMRPVTVHVGRDFRFGTRANGDVTTLERLGLTHDFAVLPHDLVASDGAPVTSTRIRALVAAGDVATAGTLLCRHTRVSGTVRHGRGEGAKLGFPTANLVPLPFAALPAAGVYAGRAILEDGVEWAAAISVGTPPSFPEARDYLEAHLVDYNGDLYDTDIMLEFWERLRDQVAYGSLEELTAAISDDVAAALDIAGFEDDSDPSDDNEWSDDDPVVEDVAALSAAEAAVARIDPYECYQGFDDTWVEVMELPGLSRAATTGGVEAFMVTTPLEAAGIPFAWDPFPPSDQYRVRPDFITSRTFKLLVPPDYAEEARQVLARGAATE